MTNGEKVVEIALKEVGYSESPPNSNETKYGKWFGWDGVMWCGIFVSWVFDKAGFNLGRIGFLRGFAGCQTAVAHFRKTGEITTEPVAGDIVFFDWNGDGRFDHVGIYVSAASDGRCRVVEGNTSLKNQSNGGQVMNRLRNPKKHNCLFVHPKVLD